MEIELRHRDLSSGMHYAPHIWVGPYAMGWHGREVRGIAARTPAKALIF